jgi:hypothetical protein
LHVGPKPKKYSDIQKKILISPKYL